MEQVKGIEPSCSAWEADILPLNYTCMFQSFYTIPHPGAECKGKSGAEGNFFPPPLPLRNR